MDQRREQQLLAEYLQELRDLRQRRTEIQAQEVAVEQIVRGLQARTGVEDPSDEAPRPRPADAQAQENGSRERRRGRGPGLKSILFDLLHDRRRVTVDEVFAYLQTLPAYENNLPARTTIVARLGDLTREGKAVSNGQGEYALTNPFIPSPPDLFRTGGTPSSE